ncbi:MAG: hypothetical protein JKY49_09840 [Cohaesibacteraceae bacterium]|nr:hypothetical protein [Cohaesibacteraceae bacterium]
MLSWFKLKPPGWLYVVFAMSAFVWIVRSFINPEFFFTTAFYIAVPFVGAALLHQIVPRTDDVTFFRQCVNHYRDATLLILGLSGLFMEGFICILFAAPIVYVAMAFGFIFSHSLRQWKKSRNTTLQAVILPVLVLVMSLEGVSPSTTWQREQSASYTTIFDADIETLKANMARPIQFDMDRHWLISVFPMPQRVQAGSLMPGDVHSLDFVYKRWFWTNIHTGKLDIRIDAVGRDFVETTIVRNDSYLASYLNIKGTRVQFDELDDGRTKISLSVNYDRTLDPVWYFGPIQSFAMEKAAQYLLKTIITRQAGYG